MSPATPAKALAPPQGGLPDPPFTSLAASTATVKEPCTACRAGQPERGAR